MLSSVWRCPWRSTIWSAAGASGGFNPEEAAKAAQVTIVGDGVPAPVEEMLRSAGCQVDRLPGDGFALAEAFARLTVAQKGG